MMFQCQITGRWFDLPEQTIRELQALELERGLMVMAQHLNANFIPTNYIPEKTPVKEETLQLPIIPEVGEDGVKRLYKTRYGLLEKQYVTLHSRNAQAQRQVKNLTADNRGMQKQLDQRMVEIEKLKALTVDTDKVDKRIRQLCKEFSLPVPDPNLALNEKLEAFFGAILCHVRTEIDQDELAD